jgi:hypothetical protein
LNRDDAKIDWALLQKVRACYISDPKADGIRDYWNEDLLHAYDETFAQRIGWKWLAVLSHLKSRHRLQDIFANDVMDWACGSGIAARVLREVVGIPLRSISFADRSSLAQAFAVRRYNESFPNETVRVGESANKDAWFLVSHVANEFPEHAWNSFQKRLSASAGFIWVEPGTSFSAAKIIEMRERLLKTHDVLGPCWHDSPCQLRGNEKDWCHFHATPPAFIHQSSFWGEFRKRMNIDIAQLPVSYLAMKRKLSESDIASQENHGIVLGSWRRTKFGHQGLVCSGKGGEIRNQVDRRKVESESVEAWDVIFKPK